MHSFKFSWSSTEVSGTFPTRGSWLASQHRFLYTCNRTRSVPLENYNPTQSWWNVIPSEKAHLKSKNEFSWKAAVLVFIQNAFEEFATRPGTTGASTIEQRIDLLGALEWHQVTVLKQKHEEKGGWPIGNKWTYHPNVSYVIILYSHLLFHPGHPDLVSGL